MNKEVIYVDVEEDITDIIGKVKSAKEKIIALVPPKGLGVLNSAVNLRLIARAAEKSKKRVVLISNSDSLRSIAAAVKIPVAKTLQSKPEIPEVDALEIDGEDIIDGEKLPVSAFESRSKNSSEEDKLLDNLDIDDNKTFSKKGSDDRKKGIGQKIPDFNKFRKRVFTLGGLGVALIAFIIWAVWFAPAAIITISAQTSLVNVNQVAQLTSDSGKAKPEEGILLSRTETITKQNEVEFEATGEKEVGERAKGTVRFSTDSIAASRRGVTIPTGTTIRASNGLTFKTSASVKIDEDTSDGVDVNVIADEIGTDYNGASGTVSGAPANIAARFIAPTSGGSSRKIKVVSQADIEKATEQLAEKPKNNAKSELAAKFSDSYKVIDESFTESYKDPISSPGRDEEVAEGKKATIKAESTYTLIAIDKSQLGKLLDEALKEESEDDTEQKVYENGLDEVKITNFTNRDGALQINLTASGRIGPNIDNQKVKDSAKGKRYGEIQADLESIDGVKEADIKFSYFWVTKVPNNDDRITVEFSVDD